MRDANGTPLPRLDKDGKPVPFAVSYPGSDASGSFLTHATARSVVAPHK